jgi:hypothetical protein
MDVSTWLRDLGLGNYVQAFQAHDIDAEVLPRLTADDLTALGITSVGHRRRLLDAIAALDRGTAPGAEPIAIAARPAEAERRQLTLLFCGHCQIKPIWWSSFAGCCLRGSRPAWSMLSKPLFRPESEKIGDGKAGTDELL